MQVVVQRVCALQAPRHGSQGAQQRGHGGAVGRLLHGGEQGGNVGQQVLGGGASHRVGYLRPLLQKRQHRFGAAAHFAQGAGAIDVSLHASRTEYLGGLQHAVGKHRLHCGEIAIELLAPGFNL